MRLLIVEDEVRLVEVLHTGLTKAGFVADSVGQAGDAREALALVAYDACVLDLGLPDDDGLSLLAEIRRAGCQLPLLILTARDAVEDRVAGLNAGADDYLVKPFAMTELVARIKALLRRPGHALGALLAAGNLTLDTVGRELRVGTALLHLPRQELAILEHLMRRLGRVVPRMVLEEKLYGLGEEVESNAIPVHVHHLRRKLAEAGAMPQVHTVRGVGYFLTDRTS